MLWLSNRYDFNRADKLPKHVRCNLTASNSIQISQSVLVTQTENSSRHETRDVLCISWRLAINNKIEMMNVWGARVFLFYFWAVVVLPGKYGVTTFSLSPSLSLRPAMCKQIITETISSKDTKWWIHFSSDFLVSVGPVDLFAAVETTWSYFIIIAVGHASTTTHNKRWAHALLLNQNVWRRDTLCMT